MRMCRAGARRLEADHTAGRLPLAGISLEQHAPVELKVDAIEGEASLYNLLNLENGWFDGLVLKTPLPLATARAIEGHCLIISGERDAAVHVDIQKYDAVHRRLMFSKSTHFYAGGLVHFQIRALIESQVCLSICESISPHDRLSVNA